MTVKVKKADAIKVLNAVKAQFKGWIDPDMPDSGPKLVKDFDWSGTGGAPYAIVWEGGPFEWTMTAGHGGIDEEFGFKIKAVAFPESVFCEPMTGWALGIYEA